MSHNWNNKNQSSFHTFHKNALQLKPLLPACIWSKDKTRAPITRPRKTQLPCAEHLHRSVSAQCHGQVKVRHLPTCGTALCSDTDWLIRSFLLGLWVLIEIPDVYTHVSSKESSAIPKLSMSNSASSEKYTSILSRHREMFKVFNQPYRS